MILPHAAAYNRDAAPDAMARVARALGAERTPEGLFDLALTLSAPTSLDALGMQETDLDRAAEISTREPVLQSAPQSHVKAFASCSMTRFTANGLGLEHAVEGS